MRHQVTKSPSHQVTMSPSHQVTQSPSHHVITEPSHQPTNPYAHRHKWSWQRSLPGQIWQQQTIKSPQKSKYEHCTILSKCFFGPKESMSSRRSRPGWPVATKSKNECTRGALAADTPCAPTRLTGARYHTLISLSERRCGPSACRLTSLNRSLVSPGAIRRCTS